LWQINLKTIFAELAESLSPQFRQDVPEMKSALRSLVTFKSESFNTSESKPYFFNPYCFGDDVCRWLIQELRLKGVKTDDQPECEDFGWYFVFHVTNVPHCFVVGYRHGSFDEADGIWIGWIERHVGLIRSICGGRNRGIRPEAMSAIHDVLVDSEQICEIRWHYQGEFDAGIENKGTREPLTPNEQ
jgi:hypothetical protein